MPFKVYTEEVDTMHEHRDAEHEHEIERKLPHVFFAATPRGRLVSKCASTILQHTLLRLAGACLFDYATDIVLSN